jgi:hypothetical protein
MMPPQQRERPVVRRHLGEDHVAGLDQMVAEEVDQLEGSVAGQDAIDGHALPLREPFAERQIPERGSVLEDRRAAAVENRGGRVDDLVDGKRFVRGHPACEIDGGGHGRPSIITRAAALKGPRGVDVGAGLSGPPSTIRT